MCNLLLSLNKNRFTISFAFIDMSFLNTKLVSLCSLIISILNTSWFVLMMKTISHLKYLCNNNTTLFAATSSAAFARHSRKLSGNNLCKPSQRGCIVCDGLLSSYIDPQLRDNDRLIATEGTWLNIPRDDLLLAENISPICCYSVSSIGIATIIFTE